MGVSQARHFQPVPGCGLTVHSRSDRVSGLVDQDAGVVVEFDNRPVRPLHLLPRADDNGVADVSSTDLVRDTDVVGAVGTEVSLLLDDDYNTVTYWPPMTDISKYSASIWNRQG